MSILDSNTEIAKHSDLMEAEILELSPLSTEELKTRLSEQLAVTATGLRRLAAIVRLLEERGEDLADLRLGLLSYLRRIGNGQMMAEVLVQYGSQPMLIRHIASLPTPDQRRFAAGEPLPLVVRREGGRFDTRMVTPSNLTSRQVSQVFGPTGLRDEAAQISLLEGSPSPKAKERETVKVGRLTADRKRRGLRIGQRFVPTAEVVAALAALHVDSDEAIEPDDDDATATASVKLTPDEQQRLKQAALDARTTVQRLLRRTLIAAGLI